VAVVVAGGRLTTPGLLESVKVVSPTKGRAERLPSVSVRGRKMASNHANGCAVVDHENPGQEHFPEVPAMQ